jgi:tetratricopeptide (TPR) repeat protein
MDSGQFKNQKIAEKSSGTPSSVAFMQPSNYTLDTFVGHKVSELTTPTATSVALEFPNHSTWLESFVLRVVLQNLQTNMRVAFIMMRRAQAAIEDYDDACSALRLLTERQKPVAQYFRALRKFEAAVAMSWQAFDVSRKALGDAKYFFDGEDGSPYQRLNSIYNKSRHTNLRDLPAGHFHTVWLQNDGIYTAKAALKFGEFEDQLRELGHIADSISRGDASAAC